MTTADRSSWELVVFGIVTLPICIFLFVASRRDAKENLLGQRLAWWFEAAIHAAFCVVSLTMLALGLWRVLHRTG